jgi:hypothetical protein
MKTTGIQKYTFRVDRLYSEMYRVRARRL